MDSSVSRRVLRRFLRAAEEPTGKKSPKRMVIMAGPPAAGKGFFIGEPDKDVQGSRFGWKFPDSTHGLFKKEDIPEKTESDESDNYMKALQRMESETHHKTLAKAHKEGKAAFDKAMQDMWYETKDGKKVQLGDTLKFDDFTDDPDAFYKKANRDFYVSMRGWHDDAKKINPETGKPTERFKDKARHMFDDAIDQKIDSKDKDLLIVDSAGEDIDAQDFKSQIERAKQQGYDVTVIFLHPEQADTELSNLARGRVQGKRMVDQSDIENWYKKNEAALKDIQEAAPDNFLHYRKPPPDPDPAKAAEMRKEARDAMLKLPSPPAQEKGEEDSAFKARQKKWKTENDSALKKINHTLYAAAPYPKDPEKSTSWGKTLDRERVPEKPEGDIAKTVQKMNEDAESRADKFPDARITPKKVEEHKEKADDKAEKGDGKGEKSKTRMDFIREVGDKKVPNPNPDSRKQYPQVKVRSLPWEHQKKFYQQWAQHQAAQRVARRFMAEENSKGRIEKAIGAVADEVKQKLKNEHYSIEVKDPKGPAFGVLVKGAQGDVTEGKKLRSKLESVMKEALKKHMGFDDFGVKIDTMSKLDDMLFWVEIIFP
jgi:hypothetical protein